MKLVAGKFFFTIAYIFIQINALQDIPECGLVPKHCKKSIYRTYDGTCNNLNHPNWGSVNSTFGRWLPGYYADGISKPVLTSVDGSSSRPLPRDISMKVFPDKFVEDPIWTLAFMQFGQFVAHDLSLGLNTSNPTGCCTSEGTFPDELPEQCWPIVVPEHDIQYIEANKTCMDFTRTMTDKDVGCNEDDSASVNPLNQINSYIDLAPVYGNDQETADSLRTFVGGKLIVEERYGYDWLPHGDGCIVEDEDEPCYRAGDVRVNQNVELTVLHTIWTREHNRICDVLAALNPKWKDEKLYQEARKINIAQQQQIVYEQFLPILLGSQVYAQNISYNATGYVDNYDYSVSPTITVEFAVGAYRYFHSAIAGLLDLINEERETINSTRLSTWNFRPKIMEDDNGENLDNFGRGLTTQHQYLNDRFIDSEFSQFFGRGLRRFGRDIQAANFQRDRDNGLRPYNEYRELFGLGKVDSIDELSDVMSNTTITILKKLYADVNDIEFSVGGFLERHVGDAIAGHSYFIVLADQFRRLRSSDRFFFDHPEAGFSLEQVEAIRKASFSRIICDNGNSITHMQPDGFTVISDSNPLGPCSDLPVVDLSLWAVSKSTTEGTTDVTDEGSNESSTKSNESSEESSTKKSNGKGHKKRKRQGCPFASY